MGGKKLCGFCVRGPERPEKDPRQDPSGADAQGAAALKVFHGPVRSDAAVFPGSEKTRAVVCPYPEQAEAGGNRTGGVCG